MRRLNSCRGHRGRPMGFTVMEVMVAVFLFALILTMIYSTWRLIFQSSQAAIRSTTDAQRARMAMRTVEDALASATMFASNPRLYFFQADTSGQFAAVSFAADLSDSFPNSGLFGGERLRRVSFYVPPWGTDLVLEQNSLLADFEQGGEPASIVLAREVQLFQLVLGWAAARLRRGMAFDQPVARDRPRDTGFRATEGIPRTGPDRQPGGATAHGRRAS